MISPSITKTAVTGSSRPFSLRMVEEFRVPSDHVGRDDFRERLLGKMTPAQKKTLDKIISQYKERSELLVTDTTDSGAGCYHMGMHIIYIQPVEKFASQLGYYRTLCHEMVHSTMGKLRPDVKRGIMYTSRGAERVGIRCREEIVADWGAGLLIAEVMKKSIPDKFQLSVLEYIHNYRSQLQKSSGGEDGDLAGLEDLHASAVDAVRYIIGK